MFFLLVNVSAETLGINGRFTCGPCDDGSISVRRAWNATRVECAHVVLVESKCEPLAFKYAPGIEPSAEPETKPLLEPVNIVPAASGQEVPLVPPIPPGIDAVAGLV